MLSNGIPPCTVTSRESLKQKATDVSGSKMIIVSDHYNGYYLILLHCLLNYITEPIISLIIEMQSAFL